MQAFPASCAEMVMSAYATEQQCFFSDLGSRSKHVP